MNSQTVTGQTLHLNHHLGTSCRRRRVGMKGPARGGDGSSPWPEGELLDEAGDEPSPPLHAYALCRRFRVLLWLALAFVSHGVLAQQYTIDWYKVSGGGGTSTGGVYSVSGTIGQHDAGGPMTGGNYSLTGGFWALYAVQTAGAPTLYIMKSGTNAVLYWSASGGGYGLVSKNDLASPVSWSAVLPAPVTVNGFNYVTNAIAPGNNFYRLRAQ